MAEGEGKKPGLFARLKAGLTRSAQTLTQGITRVFTRKRLDQAALDELEELLIGADMGAKVAADVVAEIKRTKFNADVTEEEIKGSLAEEVSKILRRVSKPLVIRPELKPHVILVAGVNGSGKTTTIGKLTRHLADGGQRVLLAAADTFRAAAREQLAVWADRNRVQIVSQDGADPAAVTFDAVTAGRARGCDVVIADTAGRLPTQLHLMEELKKIRRTIAKAQEGAPHEVLLVVDGNTGQNALAQVKAFDEALALTGIVVTKLDGTAKGGVLAAIALWARQRPAGPVAVYFIGVGETLADLETFDAREFAQALLT